MLGLPFFRREFPALKGRRISLRAPEPDDYREWADLRGASRAFLEPWEPRWAHNELERGAWRRRIRRYHADFANGHAMAFFIFDTISGSLVGGITLGNIRHGVAQSAQIGYWTGEKFAGQGFMFEAVRLLCDHAFETLRLHRIEAACIPDNLRSIRVLEKAGFRREGLLRSYLRINGEWHDHYLYALIAQDRNSDCTEV